VFRIGRFCFRRVETNPRIRRYGHFHAPSGAEAAYPGAITSTYGQGKVTFVAAALAENYFEIGSRHVRQLTMTLIDHLVAPEQRLVEVDAKTPAIEISLMSKENQWILHIIQYNAKRHTGNTVIEEIPMRYNIPVTLRPQNKPKHVTLEPSGVKLDWTWSEGKLDTVVPELHIHQMVVLEF
jgi:hypothetical protein